MYSALDTCLMLIVGFIFFIILGIITAIKRGYTLEDFKKFNKSAEEIFGKSYSQICKEKGVSDKVKETRGLMWKALWVKKWKIGIPLGIMFLLIIIFIDRGIVEQYYYFAVIGFVFSLIGLFYGLLEYLKTPEMLVLQNTTFWNENHESLKISIESQIDYMLSWAFLLVGLILNFLSFTLGILLQILGKS